MARLRKFVAYRRLERPYTRISKYREKSYIRGNPHKVIVKYEMGDQNTDYDLQLDLVSKDQLQIRHNSLESARMSCNRLLETTLGKNGYHLILRKYPHHILREHSIASGAGADRLSTGMARPFGKPVSAAARVLIGDIIFSLWVNKNNLELAKKALRRAQYKMPCSYITVIHDLKKEAAIKK
jgi:large subunit ribosomal protein L10e